MNELKSCPWCNQLPLILQFADCYPSEELRGLWSIDHSDYYLDKPCPVHQFGFAVYKTEQEAIDYWNTRQSDELSEAQAEIDRLKGENESVKRQVYRECQEEFRRRTAFILTQNKSLMDMLVNDKQVQPNVLGVDLSKDFMAQLKRDTLFDLRNAMNQEFKSKCETVGDQLTLHMFCEFITNYAAQQLKTAGEGDESNKTRIIN